MAPIKIRGLQKLGSLGSRREERGLGREREGHWRFWNGDWCARFTSPLRSRVFFSEGTRSFKCHCHFKVRKETKTRQFYTRRMQLRKAGKTEWSSQLSFLLQTRNTEILNTVRFLKIFCTITNQLFSPQQLVTDLVSPGVISHPNGSFHTVAGSPPHSSSIASGLLYGNQA